MSEKFNRMAAAVTYSSKRCCPPIIIIAGSRKTLKGIEDPSYSRMYLKSRYLKRNLEGKKFKFVTIDQASIWTTEWIKTAKPYLIPAFEIDAIVTSRLEKYRQETETWLEENKVKYKKLYMWKISNKSERNGNFARHKIDELLQLKPDMYWESTWDQSQKIWAETKIPTLCIDEMTLFC